LIVLYLTVAPSNFRGIAWKFRDSLEPQNTTLAVSVTYMYTFCWA